MATTLTLTLLIEIRQETRMVGEDDATQLFANLWDAWSVKEYWLWGQTRFASHPTILIYVRIAKLTAVECWVICRRSSKILYGRRKAIKQSTANIDLARAKTGLSFLHMNIRSLSNKFDKLTNFLGQLRVKFPIIGISETWLDDCYHFSWYSGLQFLA